MQWAGNNATTDLAQRFKTSAPTVSRHLSVLEAARLVRSERRGHLVYAITSGSSMPRRLKRVFGIEIAGCARCGGKLRIIASIEEPAVIARILAHLERTAPKRYQEQLPLGARAPPAQSRLL